MDITNRQLAIGNYNSAVISNSAHSTKGLAISGFRVWHKRIDQSLAAELYDLGNTASVLTSLSSPPSPHPPSPPLVLDCDAIVDDEGYYLVFKHDSSKGNYWSKANNNAESKRIGSNPETDYKYSRLEEVEKFGRTDEGSFQFKLEYPTLSQKHLDADI